MKTFVVLVDIDRGQDYFFVEAEAFDSEEFREKFFKRMLRWRDDYGVDWLMQLTHDEVQRIEESKYPLFSISDLAEALPTAGLVADLKRRSDIRNKEIQGKLKEQEERSQRALYESLKQKFGG